MPPKSLEAALELVRENDARQAESAPAPLAVRTLAEMAADPTLTAPPEWILQPLFERGTLNSIYGPGKIGKSTMLASMAVHIAQGFDWAGYGVQKGRVLWIDLEQGPRRLLRNFMTICTDFAGLDIVVLSELGPVPQLSAIRAAMAEREPSLVVIDSLGKFVQGQPNPPKDENDNMGWQAALQPIEQLARASSAAVVFIDHDRKGEGDHGRAMRGASSKLAAFDTAIHLKRGEGTRRQLCAVSREIGDYAAWVERTEQGYRAAGAAGTVECKVLAALRALGSPMSADLMHEHMKRLGYSDSGRTIRTRLLDAVKAGHATVTGSGKKGDPVLFSATAQVA